MSELSSVEWCLITSNYRLSTGGPQLTCQEFRGLIRSKLEESIDEKLSLEFERHCETCEACAAAYERAETAWNTARKESFYSTPANLDEQSNHPVIRLANTVLHLAIKDESNEIRIEPHGEDLNIAYRTDAELRYTMPLPGYVGTPLIARFKALANLDLLEESTPQKGYFPVHYKGKRIDVVLHTIPSTSGESLLLLLPVLA